MIRITVMVAGHEMVAWQQVRHTRMMHLALQMAANYRDRWNRNHRGTAPRAKVITILT
jgi:hypothetical protein